MEIGNFTNSYMDKYQAKTNTATSKLENKLDADYKNATDKELMDVCKQFEAYFVEQMFTEMLKTIPESESQSSADRTLKEFHKDNMVQKIASTTAETQELGLAKSLYEQMKRNYDL